MVASGTTVKHEYGGLTYCVRYVTNGKRIVNRKEWCVWGDLKVINKNNWSRQKSPW